MFDIEKLKERKKKLKLTTAQLAEKAELPVSTVSKIMTGETKNPSYATIEKIADVLNHEEMVRRVYAYFQALQEYINKNPQKTVDQIEFGKKYFKENITSMDNDGYEGNLALAQQRIPIEYIHQLGEDKQIELLDGHLIYNEAPNVRHQILVQNLGKAIDAYISANNGKCRMFNVGINLYFEDDDNTLLIPDIVVLCDESKLGESGITGAPDWIIEVVSPSTRRADYNNKMHKYMCQGVKEYWIIDPEKERVTTYIQGEPMLAYVYAFEDVIPVGIYGGQLEIRIKDYIK